MFYRLSLQILFLWASSYVGIRVDEKGDCGATFDVPTLILYTISVSMYFLLGKITGMVRLRTSFMLSCRS